MLVSEIPKILDFLWGICWDQRKLKLLYTRYLSPVTNHTKCLVIWSKFLAQTSWWYTTTNYFRGGVTIEFSEMRGPNKIFGLFCKINGQNILFGPLISENSIVTPPLGATSEESSSCCKCNTYLAVVALLKNSNFKLLPTMYKVPTSFAASKLLRDV